MQTFTRGELIFDVDDSGEGEPVVLLHGFPQDRRCWSAVTPLLTAAGCRVLAPNQRGYSPGARPQGRRAYRTSELVADVAALLDAAGLDSAHLVGHDWGAQVAWSMASKLPERVRSLTAISVPHPRAFVQALRHGQALRSWYMLAFQVPVVPELLLGAATGRRGLAGLGAQDLADYLRPLGRDGLTAALNWYRALPSSQREHGYGRSITVPTTYVWSDGDPALGRAGAERTGANVAGPYRFEVIEGAGHWLPEQCPGRIADLVLDRVRGQSSPA